MASTICGMMKTSKGEDVIRRAAVQNAAAERIVHAQKAGQNGNSPNGAMSGSADGG
jgi:hypothetical protein